MDCLVPAEATSPTGSQATNNSLLPNREVTTLTVNGGGLRGSSATGHPATAQRRRLRMESVSGIRTVWEHELEVVRAGGMHVPIWDDVDPPSSEAADAETEAEMGADEGKGEERRPTPTSVYYGGCRSRRVMLAIREDRSPLTMRAIEAAAKLLVVDWEGEPQRVETHRVQVLANWMAAVCLRLQPSPITFAVGLWYSHRLRCLYPVAKGEAGCAHRLFCVSLMLATKYHELYWVYQQRLNGRLKGQSRMELPGWWSQVTGGLFSPDELQRMEVEFIGFMRHSLYVPWEELAYFLETTLLQQHGLVPQQSAELFHELGNRKDAHLDAVPDL